MKTTRPFAAAVLAAGSLLLLSACGGSSSSSETSASASSAPAPASSAGSAAAASPDSAVPATTQAAWDAGISSTGTFTVPEVGTLKPQAGKKVTAIVFGNQSQAGPLFSDAFKAAADAAGWQANVVDGEFSTDAYLNAMKQAIAEKVDGIVLFVIDCAAVKAGAEQAQAAGIPIIYAEGYDCDSDGTSKATGYTLGLYNGLEKQGVDYTTFALDTGRLQAAAGIVAQSGAMNALVVNFPETFVTAKITEGFLAETATCAGCTATQLDVTYAEWGPGLQSKVSTALLKDPSINAIMGSYDDPVLNGIAAAVAASGRDIYITGEGAYPAMMDLIRDGKAGMTIGYEVQMEAWASVDRLSRILQGDTELFNIGLGLQAIDKDNNLPAAGQPWAPNVDYVGAYTSAWGAS